MDPRNGELQLRVRFWPVVRTALPAALPRYMGTSTVGTELKRARAASAGTRLEAPTRNARASGPRLRRDHRAALRIVSSFLRMTHGPGRSRPRGLPTLGNGGGGIGSSCQSCGGPRV